jgi:thiol-disulfide isomerase/thioredoxin
MDFAPVVIGPLAIRGDRFLVAVVVVVAGLAAEVLARRRGGTSDWFWNALIVGLVTARLGWIVTHPGSYLAAPLSALYVWQGGFLGWAGALAALFWTVGRGGFDRARQAVGLVAVAAFAAAALFLPAEPTRMPLGELTVQLESLDGTSAGPSAWEGRPQVINMWATWCGPCRRELPMLTDVARSSEAVDVRLVNAAEDRATVTSYLQAEGIDGQHVWLDRQGRFSAGWQVVGLPTTFFVDAEGRVASVLFGELSRSALEAEMQQLVDAAGQ